MKKTSNFFLIHNFNTIPHNLIKYCNDYIIYDSSTNPEVKNEIMKLKHKFVSNTGHNITSYFDFFIKNYDHLPNFICLLKGNIIGRHCTEIFFNKNYNNKYFTYLYNDPNLQPKKDIQYLVSENQFIEINNSWYVNSKNHPHKYFDNYNRLLKFIYKDPVIPNYCLFSPGACYIVSKEQILKNSKTFYENLHYLMSYSFNPSFPSEAHQIERMLPLIFCNNYEKNNWMESSCNFKEKLQIEEEITNLNHTKKKWRIF